MDRSYSAGVRATPVVLNVPVCSRPVFGFFKDKKDAGGAKDSSSSSSGRPRSALGRRTPVTPGAGEADDEQLVVQSSARHAGPVPRGRPTDQDTSKKRFLSSGHQSSRAVSDAWPPPAMSAAPLAFDGHGQLVVCRACSLRCGYRLTDRPRDRPVSYSRRRFSASVYFAAWGVAGLLSTTVPALAANPDYVMLYFLFLMTGVLLVLLAVAAQDLPVVERAATRFEGWIRALFSRA
ncbi:hypothetical protein PR202_ga06555 [Eleusine coracana subsp. coracana]|uniref:Uncharacterized protein n=1 Tax=Eleusine coracana subsp. coracana TaxID=191504 RepID=A0AAV5BX18_ELECO|nr:hypothetical protein PR202_ga06555 [Eleusine coracana subsp. coracana]